MCSTAFRPSSQTTLGRVDFKKSISHRTSVMETKVTDFVSTMSRTIKCNHKTVLYLHCFNTQNYIYPFQNLSLGFILTCKIFFKCRKFQPRYCYKIYSYIKRVYIKTIGLFQYQTRTTETRFDFLFSRMHFARVSCKEYHVIE